MITLTQLATAAHPVVGAVSFRGHFGGFGRGGSSFTWYDLVAILAGVVFFTSLRAIARYRYRRRQRNQD